MLESASSLFLLEETVFGLVFANDADVRLHAVKVRSNLSPSEVVSIQQ